MSELKNFDRMFRLDGKVALVTGGKLPSPSLKVLPETLKLIKISQQYRIARIRSAHGHGIPSRGRQNRRHHRAQGRRRAGHRSGRREAQQATQHQRQSGRHPRQCLDRGRDREAGKEGRGVGRQARHPHRQCWRNLGITL